MAQHEREDGGDEAAGESPLVVGAGAPLGADHDHGPAVGGHRGHGCVEEVEVDVVDVEVDDDLAAGGQKSGAQGPAVVRLGRRQGLDLAQLAGQVGGHRGRAVVAAVLHDHDLEGPSPVPEAVDDRADRLVEKVLLVVGRHNDGELDLRHRAAMLAH